MRTCQYHFGLRFLRHFVVSSNNHPEAANISWRNGCDSLVKRCQFSQWKSRRKDWNYGNFKFSKTFIIRIFGIIPPCILFGYVAIKKAQCDNDVDDDTDIAENGASERFNPDFQAKKRSLGSLKRNDDNFTNTSQDKSTNEALPTLPVRPPKSEEKENHKDLPTLEKDPLTLRNAINASRRYLNRNIIETGAPGMAISVSIDGTTVWSEGLGLSDMENSTPMSPHTIIRVASISKPLTMVAVCQLIEDGKLDLDAPVQKYVPSFPQKTVDGEQVIITTRHLLNHTSGIRHYKLKDEIESWELKKSSKNEEKSSGSNNIASEKSSGNNNIASEKSTTKKESNTSEKSSAGKESDASRKSSDSKKSSTESPLNQETEGNSSVLVAEKRAKIRKILAEKCLRHKKKGKSEFDLEEYYIKEKFNSVQEALQLFQDDDLLFKPGEEYYYTTHGWTLVSAVVEAAAGKPFSKLMTDLFVDLAMPNTQLDKNDPIIYRRSRYYYRDSSGMLKNSPYVDNSYKWAGGGFVSNVMELLNFGNVMLYSYQNTEDDEPKGFLKASTVRSIWTPSPPASKETSHFYGLGWVVRETEPNPRAFAEPKKFFASHTGSAVGASSVLLVLPSDIKGETESPLPKGVVVAIVTNLQGVGLQKLALKIAGVFQRVKRESKSVGTIKGVSKADVYTLGEL